MEISSRAWHLRWVRFFTPAYTPRDVCRYFWVLAFYLSFVPLLYILTWPLVKLVDVSESLLNLLETWHRYRSPADGKAKAGESAGRRKLAWAYLMAKKRRICPLIIVKGGV